jgi:predicted  nucleic acid-binding Zn-ribbon protein
MRTRIGTLQEQKAVYESAIDTLLDSKAEIDKTIDALLEKVEQVRDEIRLELLETHSKPHQIVIRYNRQGDK